MAASDDWISLDNYSEWYFLAKVRYQLIKYTFNRETALITFDTKRPLRMLRVHNTQSIDFLLNAVNWKTNRWNLYYSMARYNKGIPYQKFNLADRDNSGWKKNHWKEMVSNDFLIDIDATHHGEMDYAKDSAVRLANLFNENNIPHDIRFSGCGFHLVVPYEYFKEDGLSFDPLAETNVYNHYSLIAKKLNIEVSEMIDYKINDSRRLCKLPYSLALYKAGLYVCKPLAYDELIEFKLEDMSPGRVIETI